MGRSNIILIKASDFKRQKNYLIKASDFKRRKNYFLNDITC